MMQDPPIQFDALDQPLHPPKTLLFLTLVGVMYQLTGFFAIGAVASTPDSNSGPFLPYLQIYGLLFLPTMILTGLAYYFYSKAREKARLARLKKFATDNTMVNRGGSLADDIPSMLIDMHNGSKIKAQYSGVYKDLPVYLTFYERINRVGDSETVDYYTILQLKTAKSFPHILLDAKSNNYWFISNLPFAMPDSKKLKVEGNFNKYYDVVIMPKTEREVLTLLTPDFMEELENFEYTTDIEIEANNIFIITHVKQEQDTKPIKLLFGLADVIAKHLHEVSDSWQTASTKQEITASLNTALEARHERLKPAKAFTVVGGLFAIALLLPQLVSAIADQSRGLLILVDALSVAFIAFLIGILIYRHFAGSRGANAKK